MTTPTVVVAGLVVAIVTATTGIYAAAALPAPSNDHEVVAEASTPQPAPLEHSSESVGPVVVPPLDPDDQFEYRATTTASQAAGGDADVPGDHPLRQPDTRVAVFRPGDPLVNWHLHSETLPGFAAVGAIRARMTATLTSAPDDPGASSAVDSAATSPQNAPARPTSTSAATPAAPPPTGKSHPETATTVDTSYPETTGNDAVAGADTTSDASSSSVTAPTTTAETAPSTSSATSATSTTSTTPTTTAATTAVTTSKPTTPTATSRPTGTPGWYGPRYFFYDYQYGVDWDLLAYCEASNVPGMLNSTGKYRGLFQFDIPTWEGVGGTGDPAKATPPEQLKRAKLLYLDRGLSPWGCAALPIYTSGGPVPGRP